MGTNVNCQVQHRRLSECRWDNSSSSTLNCGIQEGAGVICSNRKGSQRDQDTPKSRPGVVLLFLCALVTGVCALAYWGRDRLGQVCRREGDVRRATTNSGGIFNRNYQDNNTETLPE